MTGFNLPVETLGWLLLAILFGITEVFTVGFFFAFFAAGAIVAALVSLFTGSMIAQIIVFVASSLAFVVFARPLLKKTLNVQDKPAQESNINALAGADILVLEPVGQYQGRVKVVHTGEVWSAYLADPSSEELPAGASGAIDRVDGAKLAIRANQ